MMAWNHFEGMQDEGRVDGDFGCFIFHCSVKDIHIRPSIFTYNSHRYYTFCIDHIHIQQ